MRDANGFTLIEVMVAAAIVAFVMLGVGTMSLTAHATVVRSAEETSATTLGLQRVEWLRNQGYDSSELAAGTTKETLSGTYVGFTRSTVVVDDTPTAGIKTVTVTIGTPAGGSVQILTRVSQ